MKTKKLYNSPAMCAHKLKLQACILQTSNKDIEDQKDETPGGTENDGGAKRGSFSYDGFGMKSGNSGSDSWKEE